MFVMFTDELFQGFERICLALTGNWCGQEKWGYPARMLHNINLCSRYFLESDFHHSEKGAP
jgi:hypothetical protein